MQLIYLYMLQIAADKIWLQSMPKMFAKEGSLLGVGLGQFKIQSFNSNFNLLYSKTKS